MIGRALIAGAIILLLPILFITPVEALSLKVAPLQYKTALKKDEIKRGFVDVSNPSGDKVSVRASVQAFKQIDDDGGLQFYDDKEISNGIKTDLRNFELGPREAIRMFFSIDGTQLPKGDVYAALFFTLDPTKPKAGVGQSVRVGTILSVMNERPGDRNAAITGLQLPFIQFDTTVKGAYAIKNNGTEATGFYPSVKLSAWPSNARNDIESSLLFGGRERSNAFSQEVGYGFHKVIVAYQNSQKSAWVLVIAPWMIVLGLVVMAVILMELILLKRRRKKRRI